MKNPETYTSAVQHMSCLNLMNLNGCNISMSPESREASSSAMGMTRLNVVWVLKKEPKENNINNKIVKRAGLEW